MFEVNKDLLNEIVRRIVEASRPKKIILFGSFARDEAAPDSDLDILVVGDYREPRYKRSAPLYGILSDIIIPMDILVYNEDEIMEWSEVPQAFVTTAIREGKILYVDE